MRSPQPTLFFLALATTAAAAAGPDVIVADISSGTRFGELNGISAYAVGTVACNIGDSELDFFANTNRHPVTAQNMFRLVDGRFEQIGMGWVLHGFFALQQSYCGVCLPSQDGQHLGVGCSDVTGASLNGGQFGMGPRSEINAATGEFPFPFHAGAGVNDVLDRRLQVANADLAAPGARYFFDTTYIAPDDAQAGNGLNNPAWREANITELLNIQLVGTTQRHEPAIFAWADADAQVFLEAVDVAGDGRFWVGSRVYDNGDESYDYEYAVYNMNSHRSAGGFVVPLGSASVGAIGFHDVPYHSGEPYDGTDWTGAVAGGGLAWRTDAFEVDANANALRWGTMYNYRFTSDQAPARGAVSIELFRPGAPDSATVEAWVPESAVCAADFNGDGSLDFFDIADFLDAFATQNPTADMTGDGVFDFFDVAQFLDLFSDGCP